MRQRGRTESFTLYKLLQLPFTLDTETQKDEEHRGEKKGKGANEEGHGGLEEKRKRGREKGRGVRKEEKEPP